jgi:hypothetical protein
MMTIGKTLILVVTAVSLAGCVSAEQEKQLAIKKAQDHCASEGKQFVMKDASADEHFGLVTNTAHAEVTGACVGPGDPGYVAPAAPSQ